MRDDAFVVLGHAVLDIVPGQEGEFEEAFAKAMAIISAAAGFRSLRLGRSLEALSRDVLLVEWEGSRTMPRDSAVRLPTRSGGTSCTAFRADTACRPSRRPSDHSLSCPQRGGGPGSRRCADSALCYRHQASFKRDPIGPLVPIAPLLRQPMMTGGRLSLLRGRARLPGGGGGDGADPGS
jgi:Antibiotic biosynthesis monooxygenase